MPTTPTPPATPPTLLSLTAPSPSPTAGPFAESGFADTLRDAAEAPTEPRSTADGEDIDTASDASVATSERDRTEQEAAPAAAANPTQEAFESEDSPGSDGEGLLLSVVPAIETIVAETAPTAVLPEEAATVIDTTATQSLDSPGGDPAEAVSPVRGFDADSDAEPDAPTEELALDTEVNATDSDDAEPKTGVTRSQAAESLDAPAETSGAEASGVAAGVAAGDRSSGQSGEEPQSGNRQPLPAEGADPAAEPAEASADSSDGETLEPEIAPKPETPQPNAETTSAADAARSSAGTDAPNRAPTGPPAVANASQVEAVESPRSAAPAPPVEIDPARFVSRVSRAFELASERGGGPIEMRLSPPELGSMQVKIEVREGVLTAQIETETQSARNALLDNLPALRERLEQQQIRIDQFNVDVRDEGRPAPDFGRPDQQAGDETNQPTEQGTGQQGGGPTAAVVDRPADSPLLGSDGRINVMA